MPLDLADSNNNSENYSWILFGLFLDIQREMSNFYRKIIKEKKIEVARLKKR